MIWTGGIYSQIFYGTEGFRETTREFFQLIALVPVAPGRTRLYLRAYQGVITLRILAHLLSPIFNWSNKIILNEDRRVFLYQLLLDSSEAANEKLFPSDKAIDRFRRLWLKTASE